MATAAGAALHLPVQKSCQHQGDRDGDRHLDDRIHKGIQKGLPYLTVRKHFHIICKTHKPVSPAESAGLEKALIDGLKDRNDIQYQKTCQGRRKEHPAPEKVYFSFPVACRAIAAPPYCSFCRDSFILAAISLHTSAMGDVPSHALASVSRDIFSHTTVSVE